MSEPLQEIHEALDTIIGQRQTEIKRHRLAGGADRGDVSPDRGNESGDVFVEIDDAVPVVQE